MAHTPRDPQAWVALLFSDRHLRLCAVVTLIVALMPPDGLPGLDLCAARRMTGLPCPGCGITRSGSNLLRGDFARAVNYHPFGPVLLLPMFLLGLLALAPRSWRDRARDGLLRWAVPLRRFYLAVLVLFVVFGIVRTFCVLEGWTTFPAAWL